MRRLVVGVVVLAALSAASRETVTAEGARSHAIYMSAVEFKGATTTDKVPAPPVDPGKMSRGTPIEDRDKLIRPRRSGGK